MDGFYSDAMKQFSSKHNTNADGRRERARYDCGQQEEFHSHRKTRTSAEQYAFITTRGSERTDMSTSSNCSGFSSFHRAHSFGENSPPSLMRRYMTSLYKHTVGQDPDERALKEINQFINAEQEKKNVGNETRWMEKLKIHLIKQGRDRESKRVVELYQKLKGMTVVKNRETIVGLMYYLFDKEPTRAIMEARQVTKRMVAASESRITKNTDICSERTESIYSKTDRNADEFQIPDRSTDASQHTVPSNDTVGVCTFDDEHTPIPSLHCSSDYMLNRDMTRGTKVPSLNKPYNEDNQLVDALASFKNTAKGGPQQKRGIGHPASDLNSISKLSSIQDMSKHRIFQSQDPVGGESNIFSSTPMESGTVSRQKQYVNLRKLQGSQHVTSKFNIGGPGTSQAFANSKCMERDLLRDVVFILQGIDGNCIKSTDKGTFEIKTKQFVHPAQRLQILKLCEIGFCYSKIRGYCEKSTTGLMAQGFKHAIEKEMQEFYRLLAVIQGRIQQTVVDTPMSEDLPKGSFGDMTMLRLCIWLFESRPRLQVLAGMVESCNSRKGGDLCSLIYQYCQHGDPLVRSLTVSLLSTICKPLYIMLSQWILYGELEDPFGEFFIAADSTCKREQLWHLKYRIRPEMLPSFISMKQAEKILAVGKNINFLKEICNNFDGYEGRYEIKAILETGEVECLFLEENGSLHYAIDMSYKTTSEKVLKVLIEDSKLLDHLKAIKKYLLLGQGDFIQYFLELIQDELSKPASKLYNHNISAILESAVRATNAQFENEDILGRLDTRILPTSDKDLGWDVFCLDYKAHGPIGTVLTEDVMNGYNKLFNSLWRTKRIEIILSTLWKNQTVLFKYLPWIPELAPVLHRSQLLISEMIHFVHQTQYYIMFEATECAWERLMEDVNKSSDLDEVIKAHKKFLDTIFKRSLLDIESRDLLNQLRGIFDSVYELRAFLLEFNGRVELEMGSRKKLQPNSDEVCNAQRNFFATYVMQAKGKIETLYTTTQDLVRTFLLVLNRQQDLTLQCLSFRLDFNEYYHQKDSRLSQPLTFQHRRLSSNAFTPLNMSGSFTGMASSPLLASMSIPETLEQ